MAWFDPHFCIPCHISQLHAIFRSLLSHFITFEILSLNRFLSEVESLLPRSQGLKEGPENEVNSRQCSPAAVN